ncbi:Fc.00g028050.m01.CDS01 [Cosmosporella sp. VM-42]
MTSKACCTIPPVSDDYTPKGTYEAIAGFNTYIVGPSQPTAGIIDIFDVFGLAPQTLQGADRLSFHTNAIVLVPDFFHGDKLDHALIPADTPEKQAAMHKFIKGKADAPTNVAALLKIREAVAEKYPTADDHWGVFGLCWGGKIGVLACGEGNEGSKRRFKVSGTAHPGALSAADAELLTAPHILLASPNESAEEVAEIKRILSQPGKTGEVETYEGMFHGWMGARANLKDEKNMEEFARGYEQASKFFTKYL